MLRSTDRELRWLGVAFRGLALLCVLVAGSGVAREPMDGLPRVDGMSVEAVPAVKLVVRSNDIYRVAFSDISGALGWSLSAVSDSLVDAGLAMSCGGRPVAYMVDTNRQELLFYGWGSTNRYTPMNVFWLQSGEGTMMERLEPDPVAVSVTQAIYSVVDEERDLRTLVEHSGTLRDDLYYWTHVTSSSEREFPLALDGYAGGDIELQLRVKGGYEDLNRASVRFNATDLGGISCTGKVDVVVTYFVPEEVVDPFTNILRVVGSVNAFLIDGFQVSYLRFVSPSDSVFLTGPSGHDRLGVDLFGDAVVLDVTDRYVPVWVADETGHIPVGYSWPASSNSLWAISERARMPLVIASAGGFGEWMRDASNRVDYLVVTPGLFEAAAREHADYRAAQGLRTAVACYEDICDHFAYGLNTPEAIHAFLAFAHENWRVYPSMVLLAGWGHYDYFGVLTSTPNYLPSMLGSDSRYLRPCDSLLADVVGGDGVPDIAIGRLPIQSAEQFRNYTSKVMEYEAAGARASYNSMFFAADNQDEGVSFTATNVELGDLSGLRYTNTHATLDRNSVADMRTAVVSAFEGGCGVVHFTGHGSYKQLCGENIFDSSTAISLAGPPVPLFLSLTCIVGRYDIYLPTQRCLGEELILNAHGGALAAIVPSGLSWNEYAAQFATEFYRLHGQDACDTLGPLYLHTRKQIGPLDGLHADAARTYNLFGDPALKLQGGAGTPPPSWADTFTLWRWERFGYNDLANSSVSGAPAKPGGVPRDVLVDYMFDGLEPEIGLGPHTPGRINVHWHERMQARDLAYRLTSSAALVGGWQEVVPNIHVDRVPLNGGVMERVEAQFSAELGHQFMRLEVTRE
jgi:hypothetical protein